MTRVHVHSETQSLDAEARALAAIVGELHQRVTTVRARHTPTTGNEGDGDRVWCDEDGHDWPCDTLRALDGEAR